ncbi:MAG: protein kinase, partial [Gemmatimonadales bacterium]
MTESLERLKAALQDRYAIERELGRGGMATVYLAHDIRHERQVAIKVMRPDIAATIGSDRFLREIRIAAKLTHPHILPLHDSGEIDGFLYYVMPYIEGESLREKLTRSGELPIPEAVRLLRCVVDALALAHKQGIVHRDIKPDNVLLLDDYAFVTDFGVAKALTEAKDSEAITTFGMAVGTPAYMSPEQAAGDPNIDHRADIYAVGAMAYEMLSGRALFEGETPQSVLAAHVSQPPTPVTEVREGLPAPLADLVMRCLEKRPADRWQSAAELRQQLDAVAGSSGSVTPVQSWGPSASAETALRRHHPARVVGTYGIASLVIVLLAYGLMQGLGLPGWVLPATVGMLALGLPVVFLTGRAERRRLAIQAGLLSATPEPSLHRWFSWRRALVSGATGFGVLALVIGSYMTMRALGIGPVGTLVASGVLEERDRIVLAEFENSTPDSTVGKTVTELLRIDLAQSPAVTVLEPGQVGRVLERMQRASDAVVTPAVATEVAQRE